MKETQFIDQNKEKWKAFEELAQNESRDPELMSNLFIEITNDLSFTRTNYPTRSINIYLNNLAQKVYTSIYKNRKSGVKKWGVFWKEELPLVMYECRRELLISFLVFITCMIVGFVSTHNDPTFADFVLGNNYVEMTKENVEKGDPMAVYKEENPLLMFLYIAWNNIKVSLLTFVMGIFGAIGTIGILAFNGVMLGTFQYYFVQESLLQESFFTIWMHGAPEISCIILAGCAGITVGKGLLFPETFSRGESLLIGVKRGMIIMLGIVPVLIIAAFVEGFATRYTEVPDVIRAIIIFSALFSICYYFVWLPRKKFHKNLNYKPLIVRLGPKVKFEPDPGVIKRNGQIYMETFWMYLKKLKTFFYLALVCSSCYVLINYFLMTNGSEEQLLHYSIWTYFITAIELFNYENQPFLIIINTLVLSLLSIGIFHYYTKDIGYSLDQSKLSTYTQHLLKHFPKLLIFSLLLHLTLLLGSWAIIVLCPFLCYLIAFSIVGMKENLNLFNTLKRTFYLFSGYWDQMIGLTIVFFITGLLFISLVNSSLLWFCFEILSWNLALEESTYNSIAIGFEVFVNVMGISMILPLFLISFGILYESMLELKEANYLSRKIEKIGERKYILGLDKEN